MIWYSAEVAGTIIVQCIPLMRPLVQDMHTSLASRKLCSTSAATNRKSYAPSKSCGADKSSKRRTLTLILQGCDVRDDEKNINNDQKRMHVNRMHLAQDENGKIVCQRRDEEDYVGDYQRTHVSSYGGKGELGEDEMVLTQEQKGRIMVNSEYHVGLEEVPEYHSNGSLDEIPEYHTIGDKEHIPMTQFHAM